MKRIRIKDIVAWMVLFGAGGVMAIFALEVLAARTANVVEAARQVSVIFAGIAITPQVAYVVWRLVAPKKEADDAK